MMRYHARPIQGDQYGLWEIVDRMHNKRVAHFSNRAAAVFYLSQMRNHKLTPAR